MEQRIVQILVNNLKPLPHQPRTEFEDGPLEELAQSITNVGILQPILVKGDQDSQEKYTIIAGERRWRAAKRAGLNSLPCIVLPKQNTERFLEMAIIENIQREELSPLDEAEAIKRLIENGHYTHDDIAHKLGKSRAAISNSQRLLHLPLKIQELLRSKKLSIAHAKLLCGVSNIEDQMEICQWILKKKLSVRQTENLIKNLNRKGSLQTSKDSHPGIRYLCDQFKAHLGTKVHIVGDVNSGKIEVSYFSKEDLDRISEILMGKL